MVQKKAMVPRSLNATYLAMATKIKRQKKNATYLAMPTKKNAQPSKLRTCSVFGTNQAKTKDMSGNWQPGARNVALQRRERKERGRLT